MRPSSVGMLVVAALAACFPTEAKAYQDLSPTLPLRGDLPFSTGAFESQPPATPLRGELPFATMPSQLPGPPRASGELPFGDTQAPTTLPGRLSGPPRASGDSPDLLYPPTAPGPFQFQFPLRGSPVLTPDRFAPTSPPLPPTTDSRFLNTPFGAEILAPSPDGGRRGEGGAPGGGRPLDARTPGRPSDDGGLTVGGGPSLSLDEALASAFRTYPPYLEALQAYDIARGELLSATGSFDLNINSDSRNWVLGYYQRYLFDVFLEQPTTLWGTKFFLGYRLGVGNWPSYYFYLPTRQSGAYVGGMEVPLLKNGRIDAKRAKLWQSEIELKKVQPTVMKQRIELARLVTRSYVTWWASGRALNLAELLTKIAIDRDKGLARQVELGGIAPVDRADSQRVVFSRQGQLVYARRRLQKAGIDLSLFLRDARTFPWIPSNSQVPDTLALPDPPRDGQLAEDTEVALRLRPEIWSIRFQGEKAEIQRQYAINQRLPSLSFYTYFEQNVGGPAQGGNLSANGPLILESSLLFDVPLQRRAAKGQIAVADATIRQIRFQERFAQDKIVAEVRDDFQTVVAAHQQMRLYRQSADVNRALEAAEHRRFELGNSTVLAVALREQARFDAELYEIESKAEYLRALADYRAALAIDAMMQNQECRLPPPTPPLTRALFFGDAKPSAEPASPTNGRPQSDPPNDEKPDTRALPSESPRGAEPDAAGAGATAPATEPRP